MNRLSAAIVGAALLLSPVVAQAAPGLSDGVYREGDAGQVESAYYGYRHFYHRGYYGHRFYRHRFYGRPFFHRHYRHRFYY